MAEKNCLSCGEPLLGRTDKKFCDDHCRSSFNNLQYLGLNQNIRLVNQMLKKNWRILHQFLASTSMTEMMVANRKLQELGFQFKYHTHIAITEDGETCFCCYDMGIISMGDEIKVIRCNEQN